MKKSILAVTLALAAQASAQSSACCMGSGYDYGVNPPLVFAEPCSCNWTGHLDYLYWKANFTDLKWATSVSNEFLGAGNGVKFSSHSNNKMVEPDWDSGFRVGLGYQFPCDKWALSLDWGHYRTDEKKQLSTSSPFPSSLGHIDSSYLTVPYSDLVDAIAVPIAPSFSVILNSSLVGSFKFEFNQVDLSLSRNFYVGPCLRIKPHMDVSFLVVSEEENICMNYNANLLSVSVLESRVTAKYKSEFKGVGIRGGLDSEWEIACGLGIYGNTSIGAYYGTFDTLNRTILNTVFAFGGGPLDPLVYSLEHSQKFQALRCTTDLALGLIWTSKVNCDKNMLTFKAGWEHHCFFGFSMIPEIEIGPLFSSDTANFLGQTSNVSFTEGSIFLHGFVFSAAFAF